MKATYANDTWHYTDGSHYPDLHHAFIFRSIGGGIASLEAVCSSQIGYGVSSGMDGSLAQAQSGAMYWVREEPILLLLGTRYYCCITLRTQPLLPLHSHSTLGYQRRCSWNRCDYWNCAQFWFCRLSFLTFCVTIFILLSQDITLELTIHMMRMLGILWSTVVAWTRAMEYQLEQQRYVSSHGASLSQTPFPC